jgi:hypothetical protein
MRLIIFMLFISFGALSQESDTILYLRRLTTREVGTNICETSSVNEISFDKYKVKVSLSLFENFDDIPDNLYFNGDNKIVELIIIYDIKDGCSGNCIYNLGQGQMIK